MRHAGGGRYGSHGVVASGDSAGGSLSRCDSGTIVSEALALSSSLGWKLREEADLVRQQWCWVLANTVVLVYGTMFLFLNLAFYRFPVEAKRLPDLGHELVPELPAALIDSGIVDLPLNLLLCLACVLSLALFVNNATAGKRNPKPHFINVLLRSSTVYAAGHVLRACTYLSTSPPGSSDRCLAAANPARFKPTLAECFFVAGDVYHNCGDLMFSGHMLLCLCVALCVHHYGESAFWISPRQNQVLVGVALLLCLAESLLILAARHHYTADVVVAWYVTPLLWYYFSTACYPRDRKPDLEALAQHVLDQHALDAEERIVAGREELDRTPLLELDEQA